MNSDPKLLEPESNDFLGKAIFFGSIAVFLIGSLLYVMFPPLKTIGKVKLRNGEEIAVYRGNSSLVDGVRLHTAVIETPEDTSLEFLASLAKAHCEEALENTLLLDTRQRLLPMGKITVKYVQGGRYLYRFYDQEDWEMEYDQQSCSVAPYLSGVLENWIPNRWEFTDSDGLTEMQIWFRWEGRGERADLPMKEVCQKLVLTPPGELRARMGEDIDTITIFAEWGTFGFITMSSWLSQSFDRVNNLCLEIGPVEEEV